MSHMNVLSRTIPGGDVVLAKNTARSALNDTMIILCLSYATRRLPIDNSAGDIGVVVLQRLDIDAGVLSNSDSLFARGLTYFGLGVWDTAAACFSEYVARYPSGTNIEDARYYYARTLFEMGSYINARSELYDFLADFPGTFRKDWTEYYIGQTWYCQSKYDSASVLFADVVTKYPDSLSADDALYFLARSEYESKNYPDARRPRAIAWRIVHEQACRT